jgi:hypothetical protein
MWSQIHKDTVHQFVDFIEIFEKRKLASQEAEPLEDITDAGAAVGGSEDALDAGQDVKVVPALVPGSLK